MIEKKAPDGLALALSCPVDTSTGTISTPAYWKWPTDAEEQIRHVVGLKDIVLANDAVSFAMGCDLNGIASLERPSLCVTLGSGIGCAVIKANGTLAVPLEAEDIWADGRRKLYSETPHELAGVFFFREFSSTLGFNLSLCRREYSRRVALVVASLLEGLEEKYNFKSVILGGGYSHFLDREELDRWLSAHIPDHPVQHFVGSTPDQRHL